MSKCYLALPLPTSLNKLYTSQFSGGRFTGKKILSKVGRENREAIILNVQKQMELPINKDWDIEYTEDNYVYMDIVAYVTRTNVDLDNTLKSLNDSIEESGLVFLNDKKVVPRFTRVFIDPTNPRVELTFSQTGWFGIFNNAKDYSEFKMKCKTCTRWREGACSIFKKTSVENKLTPEISLDENNTYQCDKYKHKE